MPTLSEVVANGDRRASLEALRDVVAGALVVAENHNVAALAKQLQAVLKELADMPAESLGDPVADLLKRRANGLKSAPNPPSATRRPVAGAGKRRSNTA